MSGLSSIASPQEQAIGDLALILFFYLLRVGEYTQKRRKASTRTIQFRYCDIAFNKGNILIPPTAPAALIIEATAATLRLSNQKNGIRGAMIHRSCMKGEFCPVKEISRRFLHMRENNTHVNEIISSFWDHLGVGHVNDDDMRKGIRRAVTVLGLEKHGILPSRVGTHSFRDGGAMALKFAGAKPMDIKVER